MKKRTTQGDSVKRAAHHNALHALTIKSPAILKEITDESILTDLSLLKVDPSCGVLHAIQLLQRHVKELGDLIIEGVPYNCVLSAQCPLVSLLSDMQSPSTITGSIS